MRSANATSIWQHRVEREAEPADLGVLVGGLDAAATGRRAAIAPAVSPICSSGRSPSLHDPPREQREREQHAGRDEQLDEQQLVQRVVDVAQRDRDDRASPPSIVPSACSMTTRHAVVRPR